MLSTVAKRPVQHGPHIQKLPTPGTPPLECHELNRWKEHYQVKAVPSELFVAALNSVENKHFMSTSKEWMTNLLARRATRLHCREAIEARWGASRLRAQAPKILEPAARKIRL